MIQLFSQSTYGTQLGSLPGPVQRVQFLTPNGYLVQFSSDWPTIDQNIQHFDPNLASVTTQRSWAAARSWATTHPDSPISPKLHLIMDIPGADQYGYIGINSLNDVLRLIGFVMSLPDITSEEDYEL